MNAVSYGEAWRHYREIYENRKVWARKPVLRRAYAELYREICENIEPSLPGIKVELGSVWAISKITFRNALRRTHFPTPGLIESRMPAI